jgi:hypothetical protein
VEARKDDIFKLNSTVLSTYQTAGIVVMNFHDNKVKSQPDL